MSTLIFNFVSGTPPIGYDPCALPTCLTDVDGINLSIGASVIN